MARSQPPVHSETEYGANLVQGGGFVVAFRRDPEGVVLISPAQRAGIPARPTIQS